MMKLTEKEIDYFALQVFNARRKVSKDIAVPCFENIGWGKLRASVLGQYSHLRRRIVLNEAYRITPEFLVSTLCHELHHQWQHDSWGFKYILLANFLTRDRCLEVSARDIERKVDIMLGMGGIRDGD